MLIFTERQSAHRLRNISLSGVFREKTFSHLAEYSERRHRPDAERASTMTAFKLSGPRS
jgi:hypothetical protein